MDSEKICSSALAAACYFRTVATYPSKKALLQITEKCNLHCEHCFVSSTSAGQEMNFDEIESTILPVLLKAKVTKVTLTGGEPLVHPDIIRIIHLFANQGLSIGICTNACMITDEFLKQIAYYPSIHFNVSLDGFSNESHGRFRGDTSEQLFNRIIENIRKLSKANRLQGILVTPNQYAPIKEYVEICDFAKEVHAKYVLINPLSEFGRGQESQKLAYTKNQMDQLHAATQMCGDDNLEIVYIRFPNKDRLLGPCVAGKILYVFTNGDIAYCPYMVFAASDKISRYAAKDFIIGNIYSEDCRIDDLLATFQLPKDKSSAGNHCESCLLHESCGKGCMAAKIAQGLLISDCDNEMCPIESGIRG